ncbi:hypothetical protein SZ25_00021 [Candidatus Arcanobacter lacustris]|jgi:hypothetical protein|uniref:Uncharacterized protein n=1 Tax=Candidatus Arcanibacter lacustris TaxID=1607817 RepID=A0A0F5MQ36_9RICK|nr:hypothetical protein SZ25_00021 [Candidatus Arcanobacter lacustris]
MSGIAKEVTNLITSITKNTITLIEDNTGITLAHMIGVGAATYPEFGFIILFGTSLACKDPDICSEKNHYDLANGYLLANSFNYAIDLCNKKELIFGIVVYGASNFINDHFTP